MALTETEAEVYDVLVQHKPIRKRRPKSGITFTTCLCGDWEGPLHNKHLAHEIVKALTKKEQS